MTGLKSGVTYHFRLIATSDAGSVTGADQAFTTHSAPAVVTGAGDRRRPDLGDARRHREPQRAIDVVVRRVRNEHLVRVEDLVAERRLGDSHPRGRRHGLEPEGGRDLSLPPRRDERARDDARRGCDVHDDGRAVGCDRARQLRDAVALVCACQRHRQPARPGDDLVVRVRSHGRLRVPQPRCPRDGHHRRQGPSAPDRAFTGSPLALPRRRPKRCGDERRSGCILRHSRATSRPVWPSGSLHDRRVPRPRTCCAGLAAGT